MSTSINQIECYTQKPKFSTKLLKSDIVDNNSPKLSYADLGSPPSGVPCLAASKSSQDKLQTPSDFPPAPAYLVLGHIPVIWISKISTVPSHVLWYSQSLGPWILGLGNQTNATGSRSDQLALHCSLEYSILYSWDWAWCCGRWRPRHRVAAARPLLESKYEAGECSGIPCTEGRELGETRSVQASVELAPRSLGARLSMGSARKEAPCLN